MFARLITVHAQPGKIEEAATLYRDSVIPAAKKQKGFKGAMLLTDPVTGKGLSITLWETEADQKAGESSGYVQQQLGKMAPLLAGPPVRESLVVSAKA
ncbi:MAG: antibiotic biosynthesis monooxygenase family protein [Polaromonas sp.]